MPIGGFGVLIDNHSRDIFNNYATIDTNASSSTSADTFGSWVELIADVGDRDIMITAFHSPCFEQSGEIEIEIGIGAAASEVRIFGIGKMGLAGTSAFDQTPIMISVDIRVPASSRVAFRVKDSETNANTHNVAFHYLKI